jgi:hypothetical protein
MRTNYFVAYMQRGDNYFELAVNHFTRPEPTREDEALGWTFEDGMEKIIFRSGPVLEEGVVYVFEKIGRKIVTRRETYYRKGSELVMHMEDPEPQEGEEELLSVAEIKPSLGICLDELRLVAQIANDPLNWELLQKVPMPSDFNLLTQSPDPQIVVLNQRRNQTEPTIGPSAS